MTSLRGGERHGQVEGKYKLQKKNDKGNWEGNKPIEHANQRGRF